MKTAVISSLVLFVLLFATCRQKPAADHPLAGNWQCVDMFVNIDTNLVYDIDWNAFYDSRMQVSLNLSDDSIFQMINPSVNPDVASSGKWYQSAELASLALQVLNDGNRDTTYTTTFTIIRSHPDTLWLMSLLGDTLEQIEVFARVPDKQ